MPKSSLKITERVDGSLITIDFTSAAYVDDNLVITFPTEKTYNAGGSPLETSLTNHLLLQHPVLQLLIFQHNMIIVS